MGASKIVGKLFWFYELGHSTGVMAAAYFEEQLIDYERGSKLGNWQ